MKQWAALGMESKEIALILVWLCEDRSSLWSLSTCPRTGLQLLLRLLLRTLASVCLCTFFYRHTGDKSVGKCVQSSCELHTLWVQRMWMNISPAGSFLQKCCPVTSKKLPRKHRILQELLNRAASLVCWMQQTDFSEAQQAWTLHWYQSHFVLYWQSKEWIWCHTQITKRKLNRKEHKNALPPRFLGGCNWEERYNWVGGVSTRHSSWDYSFKPWRWNPPRPWCVGVLCCATMWDHGHFFFSFKLVQDCLVFHKKKKLVAELRMFL